MSDYHGTLPQDPARRAVLLTPDWSRALDATTTSRYRLRLTREDILGGTTSVFDPADERVLHARAQQHATGTFTGPLRLRPHGGTPFEATVSVVPASPPGVEVDESRGLALLEFETESQVPVGLEQEWSRHPLHHSPDVVALYEADGTLRYISPSVREVLGYAPEEMVGLVTIGLVHPEDVEPMIDAMLAASQVAGPSEPIVFRVRHRDGRWRHLEVMLRDLSDDPEVGGSTVHFRDITPRIEALRRSYFDGLNAREGSAVGIASLRADGQVVRCNDRFAAILGRPREELEGARVPDLVHPDDGERLRSDLERAVSAGAPPAGDDASAASEWRFLRPDGTVGWVAVRLLRPGAAADLAEAAVVTVEDVSDRKEAEHLWSLLTPREQDVLALVGQGWNNRDIAAALHVSVHTVKHHVQGLLRKLGVADRVQAAARVADLGSPPARR